MQPFCGVRVKSARAGPDGRFGLLPPRPGSTSRENRVDPTNLVVRALAQTGAGDAHRRYPGGLEVHRILVAVVLTGLSGAVRPPAVELDDQTVGREQHIDAPGPF